MFPKAKSTVYPGIAYAHLSFDNESDWDEILSKCTEVSPAYYFEIEERPVFLICTELLSFQM